MTAAQLTYLAELAAYAAGFFAATDPAAAVMFKDAALRADTLSAELRQDEDRAGYGPYLHDVQPTFPIRDARLTRVARPRWDAITVARTESKNPSSHVPWGTCLLDRHTGAR